jgi:putative oxidoreductase
MKTMATISRFLLGLVFTVFGLNGFLHFIPMSPIPPLAGQFLGALIQSHYVIVVFALQLLCGLLLLANRYIPLALTVLGPVIFHILLFHFFMAPSGLPLAGFVALLWLVLAYPARSIFAVLLQQSFEQPTLRNEAGHEVHSVA